MANATSSLVIMHNIQTEFASVTFSTHDWRRYRRLVLFLTWTFAPFAFASFAQAQQPNRQDAFQEFFDLQSLCSAVKPLMTNAQRYTTIDLILVESEATDAYSIPGGHIVVTRGLLETVGTEAALVGVLAHELSHLDRGHQLLTLKQMRILNQSFDMRNPVESMAIAFKPFRPEFETQSNELRTLWPNATYTGAKNLEQRIPANKRRFTRQNSSATLLNENRPC